MNKENAINDKPLPTHELIYRGLRSEILGGLLNPGQVLTLRSLAKKFNVSTMPV
ncbi:MAG: GntR family transcriptional regulator, partial [Alphaproteobacteria bacterium]|nr:GntR family transcriptional regulator [Alphaproteobacteria bacterium]